MSLNPLFVSLLLVGLVVVLVVIGFNATQLRKMRRRMEEMQRTAPAPAARQRVEPRLADQETPPTPAGPGAATGIRPFATSASIEVSPEEPAFAPAVDPDALASPLPQRLRARSGRSAAAAPDPDVECVATLRAPAPVSAAPLAAEFDAKLAKPLRWFARRDAAAPWQSLNDGNGQWSEYAVCMLLADRAGAATRDDIEAFGRFVAALAPRLPADFVAPDAEAEASRAEALDRICASLDVQVGLTLLKGEGGQIAGTRLRGVAEASGFKLNGAGCFDYVQEETGATLFSLQNYRNEPFTAEAMRTVSTPGFVLLLDVPRVSDPVRVFDQMRLIARRMSQTLEAALVDDNRRVLDDAALASIRSEVDATADALRECRIEPGGTRALQLFG